MLQWAKYTLATLYITCATQHVKSEDFLATRQVKGKGKQILTFCMSANLRTLLLVLLTS